MSVTTICPACFQIRPCHCGQSQASREKRRRDANNVRLGRNTQHWRRLRARRLELTGGLCEVRLPGCTGRAESVHLIGGGNHATAVLELTQASCLRCHGRLDGGKRGGFFAGRDLTIRR